MRTRRRAGFTISFCVILTRANIFHQVEQEEVETMQGINKILLENILPAHVADRFLQNLTIKVSQ